MNIAIDETGNPILILREQEKKRRIKGRDAHRANILAARMVADTLRTSLGPKGMDKIIVGPDGDVTVTNDGATILNKMEINHQCAKLLVQLSKSQDAEIGDGTTAVVILAGALLDAANRLFDKGLHPLKISDGYDTACQAALEELEKIAVPATISEDDQRSLVQAAMTSLASKVVSSQIKHLAEVAIDAVLSVADFERKDVNFDLIKIEGKVGGRLEDTCVIKGIVIDKEFSHPHMVKEVKDAKIAILTCPFEPPKPKTKHKIDIRSADDYRRLAEAEMNYFKDMVDKVQKSGANLVICQWGFDDEANHLLMQNNIPAVRWVGGVEIELIAIATGGRIVPRFEDLTPEKLGYAKSVREVSSGTQKENMIIIEECSRTKAVSLLVRGGNEIFIDEAKRSLHDCMCCIRNLVRDNRLIPGGGATEIAMSRAVDLLSDKVSTVENYAIRGFADALRTIPEALADNSGLNAINAVTEALVRQEKENNPNIGIDCLNEGCDDMLKNRVVECYSAKRHQIALATQVVKMILKIDDVIEPNESYD